MSIIKTEKADCSGCSACFIVCHRKAILLKPDKEGFLYPEISEEKCSGCGLCASVCSFGEGYDTSSNLEKPIVYAAKHISEEVLRESTSGGMFTALTDEKIAKGGIVYGVELDENLYVKHSKAKTFSERDKYRYSKYVQSDLLNCFSEIREELSKGISVLFSGTPCQTVALRKYLRISNIDTEKLLLVDVVCHGVPSPLMWREYVELRSRKKKIKEYYFRKKIKGWGSYIEMCVYEDGRKDYKSFYSQAFKALFQRDLILRPSCYKCPFANMMRPSDITIGDFWGIEKVMPEFYDEKGVSLVLVNTEKGEAYFEKIKGDLEYRLSNEVDCLQMNLKHPTPLNKRREVFWEDYYNKGFKHILNKYCDYGLRGSVIKILKRICQRIICV